MDQLLLVCAPGAASLGAGCSRASSSSLSSRYRKNSSFGFGAYGAIGRPPEKTERAIRHSLVFGVYDGDRQIGMARVVSDYSIFAYLCDVFIHENYRTQGLGKSLIQTILEHPDLVDVRRWLLVTNDAHGLYRQFGFTSVDDPERWMQNFKRFAQEE